MKRWYILHVISGKENDIKENIKKKIYDYNMFDLFGEILIPTEELVEMKLGKKEKITRVFFPGYILIEMLMNYKTWFLVRHTSNVINFIGGTSGNPIPVNVKEIRLIIEKITESIEKPKPKKYFELGEMVRVINGPFSDFNGTVEEINYSKNKLCVGVLIFGRSTPIDLNFNQVEKI